MSESIKDVDDQSFDREVMQADQPVLLDFWAKWCGPCKIVSRILEELAGRYGDRLKIVKMDVDNNQATPAKFQVRGIPTLILFKNGVFVAQKVGALSKGDLVAFLDSNEIYPDSHHA